MFMAAKMEIYSKKVPDPFNFRNKSFRTSPAYIGQTIAKDFSV